MPIRAAARRVAPLVLLLGCAAQPGPPDQPADTIDTPDAPDTADSGAPPVDPPVAVGDPDATGLAGGWTIIHAGSVAGARFIHPINTDKDGAMVAARVASALGALGVAATSDSRAEAITATRMSDATYVDEVTSFVVDDLYGAVAQQGQPEQGLLNGDTLVFTSVHRYGLYVAEALHAPVLPLQVLSFAEGWADVEAAATRAVLIVGRDGGYGGLWVWNKLAAGVPGTPHASLPDAYLRALGAARRVVIVQPDDNWALCTPEYCHDVVQGAYETAAGPVWLHSSLGASDDGSPAAALLADAMARGVVHPAPEADVANLKQWEWGVPDSAVANLRAAWAALGKPSGDLVVVRGGVVDLFARTPHLWRAYLAKNGVEPQGFHLLSYWAAAPALERAGGVLPFPSYAWWQPAWHPLDDNARALLLDVCGGPTCAPHYAASTRAFVNTIGSADEMAGTQDLLTDYGLTPALGAYYGVGVNALGAGTWTGWDGEPVAPGWEQVAIALQDPAATPYAGRAWTPLSVEEVCAVTGCE